LGLNKKESYLPFIKILYEGVKLKSLPLSNDKVLYRGSKIRNDEVKYIKDCINKKIKGLPSSIAFSKSFLSFSKEKNVAEKFLNNENKDKNLSKVLFILEKMTIVAIIYQPMVILKKFHFFQLKEKYYFSLFLPLK
jgi:hypothetical protein